MSDILSKRELIHALSDKTNYTIKDSKVFFNALVDIMEECVFNNEKINVACFGKLYTQIIPERDGFQPVPGHLGEGTVRHYPPAKRVIFRLSRNIRGLAKRGDEEDDTDSE